MSGVQYLLCFCDPVGSFCVVLKLRPIFLSADFISVISESVIFVVSLMLTIQISGHQI